MAENPNSLCEECRRGTEGGKWSSWACDDKPTCCLHVYEAWQDGYNEGLMAREEAKKEGETNENRQNCRDSA